MKRKNRVKNPIAHADGGVSEGKTFNRTTQAPFPNIPEYQWNYPNYWSTAQSAKELAKQAFFRRNNRAERIKDYLAKNLVYDATSYLMNYDLNDKSVMATVPNSYKDYFYRYPYEYFQKVIRNITDEEIDVGKWWEKVKDNYNVLKLIYEDLKTKEYEDKIRDILDIVTKYQGATYDPIQQRKDDQEASQRAAEREKEENKQEWEEENPPQIQSNSPNYLLIGGVILLSLYIFKKSKS